jgi:hypothetical protein
MRELRQSERRHEKINQLVHVGISYFDDLWGRVKQ